MGWVDGHLPGELSIKIIFIRVIQSTNTYHIQRKLILILSMQHFSVKDLREQFPAFQSHRVAVSIDLLFTSQPSSKIKSCETLYQA
jgi:hypothetical protein